LICAFVQEVSTMRKSDEWSQTRQLRLEEGSRGVELAKATLRGAGKKIQEHAAHLQHWLNTQQADSTKADIGQLQAGMISSSLCKVE